MNWFLEMLPFIVLLFVLFHELSNVNVHEMVISWPLKGILTSQVRLLPGCLRSGTDSQQMSQDARKSSPPLSTCCHQVWTKVFSSLGSHPLSLNEGGLVHAVLVSQGRERRLHTGPATFATFDNSKKKWFLAIKITVIINAHLTHRSTGFFIHCSNRV